MKAHNPLLLGKDSMKAWLILIVLLTMPSISAQQTLGTFQQHHEVILIQTCTNSSYSNITRITYPNSTYALHGDFEMTKDSEDYNYSFFLTTEIGQYLVYGNCDEEETLTNWVYDFSITPTGDDLSTSESIIYFLFLVGSLFVFLGCLFGALKIKWEDNKDPDGKLLSVNDFKYLKIVFWFFAYVSLLFMFGIMRSLTANYLVLEGAKNFFNLLYWILFVMIWPIVGVSFLVIVIALVDSAKLKKAIMRGLPTR